MAWENQVKPSYKSAKSPDANVVKVLKDAGAEVMVNLLPSGASKASEWYAEQALAAGCAFR